MRGIARELLLGQQLFELFPAGLLLLGLLLGEPGSARERGRFVDVEDAGFVEAKQHLADRRLKVAAVQLAWPVPALVALLEPAAEPSAIVERDAVRQVAPIGGAQPDENPALAGERQRRELSSPL